ncbi:MAG TPA: pitrilysin family protein [Myxococcaceae bacterium]|nr:pitrilysin family protein [Myxococcaceae bacterium]
MTVRYRLENGLTVVFEEQHAAHVVAFQVWVRVGSADERPDQAGLAHLHEHMLFKGTASRGPGEIARTVEMHGGEINAWTSFDQTVYHVVIASQFARIGLEILGDAVRDPAFDEQELAREIEVVCEEIKRSQDNPARRASRDLFATAYAVHPYQRPVIGWEETVRGFTREKVLEFYRRHYTPGNLVLSAVGDVPEAALREWVEEIFGGDWGRPHRGPVSREPEPPPTARRYRLRPDDVKEVHVTLAFPIPDVMHEDTPALDALAMIAGQGEASRLSLEVKRKRGLVNEVQAWAYTPKDPGLFTVTVALPPDKLGAALEETLRVLARLCAAEVTLEELRTVQALIEAENVYQRETVQGLARKLGFYESSGGGIEREAAYYERVAGLTPENVRDVARRYLRFDRLIATALLPSGVRLESEELDALVNRVMAETPRAESPRTPRPKAPAPMRITAPLMARTDAGGLVVETLPSGATVIVREESAVPLFAMRGAFLGGVRYETPADNGRASLLARTLTRGTPTRDAEDISRLIDELAGSLSAACGRNSVTVRGDFLSRHFHRAFELFADVLRNPTFPEPEVQRERTLLLQDILTRDDKPSGVAFDLFARTLFDRHPYRLPLLGERAAVERLTREALLEWHERYMDPSQLVLAVVGDVRASEVVELARQAFGEATGKAGAPPRLVPDPPLAAPRRVIQTLPRAQSHLVLGFRGPRVTDPWRRTLEVICTILSGQGGRLFVELRDKQSLAYSVSSLAIEGVDPGYVAVYMGTSPEKVDVALAAIRQELARLREERVSDDELLRAKRHLVGTHEIGLQRNGARAALLALDYLYGLGTEPFHRYADEIFAVTASDVQEVARRVIDFDREALAIVGP